MLTLATAPFVFVRALLKDPTELAAGRARRDVCEAVAELRSVARPSPIEGLV